MCCIGNLAELNDAEGVEFLEKVLSEYGPISKLHGIGGVRVVNLSLIQKLSLLHSRTWCCVLLIRKLCRTFSRKKPTVSMKST